MSESIPNQELELLLASLCNDTMTEVQHAELQHALVEDAHARERYFNYLDLHHGLRQLHVEPEGRDALGSGLATVGSLLLANPSTKTHGRDARSALRYMIAAALMLCASVALVIMAQRERTAPQGMSPAPVGVAQVIQTSAARFAGEAKPPGVGAMLGVGHEYAMRAGLIEIQFQGGANVILEGPVVFEVAGPERLMVQFGKCSVHAPEGAEGFVVETPLSRVVDLGTRFAVEVDEAGETVVQVIEGAAEVHWLASDSDQAAQPDRLTQGASRKYLARGKIVSQDIPYNEAAFTRRLPDRVVSYTATTGPDGGAQELATVTLQRSGRLMTYDAAQLVGTEVTHFHGAPSGAYMTVGLNEVDPAASGTARRTLLDGDRKLNTGLINPGGSREPLVSDPVLQNPADPSQPTTPGLAVRFLKPVVNGPGPDVVLFELHVIVQSEEGDVFHVSPLRFAPGRKSYTVHHSDISLSSPEALKLSRFRLFKFDAQAGSLAEFEQLTHNGGVDHVIGAKALVVGIDLSDLGYHANEIVEGLFFQDAMDDKNYFDPVFIAGLPTLSPASHSKDD